MTCGIASSDVGVAIGGGLCSMFSVSWSVKCEGGTGNCGSFCVHMAMYRWVNGALQIITGACQDIGTPQCGGPEVHRSYYCFNPNFGIGGPQPLVHYQVAAYLFNCSCSEEAGTPIDSAYLNVQWVTTPPGPPHWALDP